MEIIASKVRLLLKRRFAKHFSTHDLGFFVLYKTIAVAHIIMKVGKVVGVAAS